VASWAEMKDACESFRTLIPAEGTVILSDDFMMETYNATELPQYGGIDFSRLKLVIKGNNKTLDAGKNG
jgi:hypothetical protein